MSNRVYPLLNDCGCCKGMQPSTPSRIVNRPGLETIGYRVGTHSLFNQSMLAHLSRRPELAGLRTRETDDFVIALIDAWACTADVLAFYNERILNESCLRCAKERLSVLELARLTGYRPSPGLAANTHLAFSMDEAPGAPEREVKASRIDTGAKVQSTPGPGEKPVLFETVQPITARVDWNAIKVRTRYPQAVSAGMGRIVLQGIVNNVVEGDLLAIIVGGVAEDLRFVARRDIDLDAATTTVSSVGQPADSVPSPNGAQPLGSVDELPVDTSMNAATLDDILARRWRAEDLCTLADVQGWDLAELSAGMDERMAERAVAPDSGVFVFRQRAALFGHNAPKLVTYQSSGAPKKQSKWKDNWPTTNEVAGQVSLDGPYGRIVVGGYAALQFQSNALNTADVYPITAIEIRPRADYGLAGNSTRLTLSGMTVTPTMPQIRATTVFTQSEQLALDDVVDTSAVAGERLVLAGAFLGLKPGQWISVQGDRSDMPGARGNEVRRLHEVWIEHGFPVLFLDRALDNSYVRDSVRINANVAEATHGESVDEVLGSGDATRSFQRFVLNQTPLTYTSAEVASGVRSSLRVFINKIEWHEVATLYGQMPTARAFVTAIDDHGRTAVIFGDGLTGARLPTGQDNVRASYRRGLGSAGLLKPNQLDQLMTRPLGVQKVTNPVRTMDAADPETRDMARRNAPLQVLTLGRAVSLQDYEDFARGFAGVSKAQAIWTWNRGRKEIFVTIAGPDGSVIESGGAVQTNLLRALRESGDEGAAVNVGSFVPGFFRTAAGLVVHPDYEPKTVLAAVRQRVGLQFSFEEREFVQPVSLSEVVATMQSVDGIIGVDVDALYRADSPVELSPRLLADAAIRDANGFMVGAELLMIDPASLDQVEVVG